MVANNWRNPSNWPASPMGELKKSPDWDPLRDDPGFEKLVAPLASKEIGAVH
jgi:hypothetical protein